ncbi:hypothetical protein DFP73DRAFT_136051 [Morchella snyderi]|nr:hypothetical protein DFP73DRAFT_136051 [Morchella snyderi]
MSRKSALQTLTASGLFNTTPHHSSSITVSDKSTPRNPYILQEEIIPGKTPYTRRHHGKSSGLVSGSKGGSGKDGRNGGKNGNGGNQGQSDNGSESSCSQDDEEEDEEEDEDEEDEEEPAVSDPVRVNDGNETAIVDKSFLGHPARATISTVKESLKGDHRTGSNLKKRAFSMTEKDVRRDDTDLDVDRDAENESGNESDYPRKRIATELSNTNGILTYHSAPPSVVTTDTTPYDLADLDDLDDLDDEDILDDEESALIQEFEANGCDTPVDLSTHNTIFREYGDEDPTDPNLITAEELEDLDNEVFGVGWGDPNAFHDISLANDFTSFSDPFADIQLDYGLFPESISEMSGAEFSTPFDTPNYTPRGSFSGIFSEADTPDNSTESDDDDDDDDDFNQLAESVPYFERKDPALKHIVDTAGEGGWADDSDEEHGLSWKLFFSKGEVNGGKSEEDSETDEGETTDEEEDLPMPTPRSKSMLRRASVSSVGSSRPQVVHIDNTSGGPTVASWVADPNRTICVIDGSKKTFLLPGASRGYEFNTGGADVSRLMLEESESEKSTDPIGYNPTLGGFIGDDGLFLDGNDILGPEALYDNLEIDGIFDLGDLDRGITTNDDEIDEFEQDLQITDFLDFSTDDADGETHDDNSDGDDDDAYNDDGDDECIGAVENSEDMLARWDQVAVTSFRKRQMQHSQGNILSNNPATSHKIGDRRLSQTITPARKKKVRSRFMVNSKGSGPSSGVKKVVSNKKGGANISVGSQWGLIDI